MGFALIESPLQIMDSNAIAGQRLLRLRSFPVSWIQRARVSVVLLAVWLAGWLMAICAQSQEQFDASDSVGYLLSLPKAYDPWNPPAEKRARGQIRSLDGEELVLVQEGGVTLRMASQRVVSADFSWRTEEARQSSELVKQQKYRQAITRIPTAYQSGVPRWQQRFLIAQLVQSLHAIGEVKRAGIIFLNLVESAPPDLLYADMPLCWTVVEPSSALQQQALDWMEMDTEEARLLGASWLLQVAEQPEAIRQLRALARSENLTVAQLATMQLWRVVPPPDVESKLHGWMAIRDQLIQPLQLGPTELLADRAMRIGKWEIAVGQWMRIATTNEGRYHRVLPALESAVQQLENSGRRDEAKKVEAWILQLKR